LAVSLQVDEAQTEKLLFSDNDSLAVFCFENCQKITPPIKTTIEIITMIILFIGFVNYD